MIRLLAALAACAIALWSAVLPATAASISIVSMQYSAAHPVPHIHYDGETVQGDVEQLQQVYDMFVHCRLDCIGQNGGATAVLTLNGPGGSYGTGLDLADFLRANHIATVVERGMQCYSACAFAFLGGSGYSPMRSVGTYIDRMVEPGSIVGFHAPYRDEESFMTELAERGANELMGDTRNSIALMVHELVKWNVDPAIIFKMVEMGPDETYNLVNAEDLYLTRTALPPTPTSAWVADWPNAIRNACLRLLTIYDGLHPYEEIDRITSDYQQDIGNTELSGPVSGYRLSDSWLDVGHCSATDKSLATGEDLDLALYFNPVLTGPSRPILSFFNRNDGWSSAGIGGLPTRRIFQRGAMNHYFLPMGINIDDLDLPGEDAIDENRFVSHTEITLPPAIDGPTVLAEGPTTRISQIGNVWLFEQVGNARLFTSAVDESYQFGFDNEGVTDSAFVRDGVYPGDGTRFGWVGFRDGDSAETAHVLVLTPAGQAATAEELNQVRQIECALSFAGQQLAC